MTQQSEANLNLMACARYEQGNTRRVVKRLRKDKSYRFDDAIFEISGSLSLSQKETSHDRHDSRAARLRGGSDE